MSNEALLREFDAEMAKTRQLLACVPEDHLDFKPHEKSWSMLELAAHIGGMPVWAAMTYDAPEFDMAASEEPPPAPTTAAEILERFDATLPAARASLAGLSADQLGETWTFRNGDEVIFAAPRGGVHRSMIMNHMAHHRGQMTVYLRMCDIPVPGLYGPSADDRDAVPG